MECPSLRKVKKAEKKEKQKEERKVDTIFTMPLGQCKNA